MDKDRIIRLLKAYQEQTATTEERKEFAEILHNPIYEALLNQILDQDWDKLTSEEIDALEIPGTDRILKEIKQQPQISVRKINIWPRIAIAAASILIIFSVGLYFYNADQTTQTTSLSAQNDIDPGKNGATLTLANGKKILINDVLEGNIANEFGIKITKTKDGQLVYEMIGDDPKASGYNTLSTSRGEQTQVRLQDGTVIFLNAESSVTYPISFTNAKIREVTMTGEAYFEVAKVARKSGSQEVGNYTSSYTTHNSEPTTRIPFIVKTVTQQVEVLGTHFNINAYAEESSVNTTLLEGAVRVQTTNGLNNQTTILKPGEQSMLKNLELTTRTVETDDVIAWKNGEFMFSNETLESIMKKVTRWYNIEVIYKDDLIKKKTFFGNISRFAKVSDLLNLLQKTDAVVFEIKDNQIIVDKK